MAAKQNTKKALEDKLKSLKKKQEVLEKRGPSWTKAKARNASFIKEIEAQLADSGKKAPAKPTTDK